MTEDNKAGNVELGFFNRATVNALHPIQIAAPGQAHWVCQSGKDWSGTRLLFDLAEQKGQTVLRFTHANWAAETDYFISCNTTCGERMFPLKAAAEGKKPWPLFSGAGLAYWANFAACAAYSLVNPVRSLVIVKLPSARTDILM